ncbi:MAG: hypothetical protein AAF340_02880, partial [Pseudomonadota bacterium]
MLALVLLLSVNVPLVQWLSLAIFLAAIFVLISGRPVPRIQSRAKGFVMASVAGICLIACATISQDQRDEGLAILRSADPDAYLTELERVDETRWLAELEALRPERYEAEMQRRELAEQAERERECTDRTLGEAYVMIQNDVRQHLTDSFWGLSNGGFLVHRSHHGAKMNKKSGTSKDAADKLVRGIKR